MKRAVGDDIKSINLTANVAQRRSLSAGAGKLRIIRSDEAVGAVEEVDTGDAKYVLAGSVMLVNARIADANLQIFKLGGFHDACFEVAHVAESFVPVENNFRVIRIDWISCVVEECIVDEEKSWIGRCRINLWYVVRRVADVEKRALIAMTVKSITKLSEKVRSENLIFLVKSRMILHLRCVLKRLVKSQSNHCILEWLQISCRAWLFLFRSVLISLRIVNPWLLECEIALAQSFHAMKFQRFSWK